METQPPITPEQQTEPMTQDEGAPSPIVPPEQGTLENVNLVPALMTTQEGRHFLEELGKRVIRKKDEDEKSGEGYRECLASALEMYLGRGGTFTKGPAKGSPRPVHPTLAKIVNRTYSRVISVVLQTEPIAVPTADDDIERALRLAQHIAWEKRAKHPDWAPTMADSAMQWVLFGSMFRAVEWDVLENKKSIDYMSCGDLILPYSEKDSSPDMRRVERISRLMRMPKHRIKRLGMRKWFENLDIFDKDSEIKASPVKDTDKNAVQEVVAEFQGQTADNSTGKRDSYQIVQQHMWCELPEIPGWNPDKDVPRRVAVWVEQSTKKVLRLVIMEREIRVDRIRFENESKLKAIQIQNWREIAARAAMAGQQPPPNPAGEIAPPAVEPVFSIIHYRFMPNPEGIYGLGAWAFVGPLNEVINDLLGEDIIAHRMANIQGGLVSDDVAVEKGTFELEYGKFNHLEGVTSQQLKDGVLPLPFERPKGNLSGYIEKLDQEAQAVTSSSDQQSGVPGPSHETATAARARAYQGSTATTAAVEQFLIPLAYEYKLYARLNSMFLPDTEYFFVTEPHPQTGAQARKQVQITRADYDTDYDITFEADVRLEVDPGIGQSALEAYALIRGDQLAAGDPNLQLAALKKALRALKAQDLASRLPDNIPPPPPPSPMSQVDEIAGFMNEQDHPVLPDDDDIVHLADMAEYKATDQYKALSPTGKQLFDRHERGHMAQAYKKGKAIQQEAGLPRAMPVTGAEGMPPEVQ